MPGTVCGKRSIMVTCDVAIFRSGWCYEHWRGAASKPTLPSWLVMRLPSCLASESLCLTAWSAPMVTHFNNIPLTVQILLVGTYKTHLSMWTWTVA